MAMFWETGTWSCWCCCRHAAFTSCSLAMVNLRSEI
eukprot:CAMPEP_0198203546 /NCGR_PEP_ID=MMETSP1445-20131203/6857_1 /TAXON_ID=36898 /ORGANISM="Pyramimonas sp., Strain CCMP2087" /LENGTH=35 /DNA_ID= /DNA_START= /DNA_END= /DNA_ORIENTATION=